MLLLPGHALLLLAFLIRFSPKMTLLVRGSERSAHKIAADKASTSPQMEVCFHFQSSTNGIFAAVRLPFVSISAAMMHMP